MKVVVDTSVLIDHLRGDARAATVLRQRIEVGDELWSVTPVRTEILAGMRPREAAVTLALLDSLAWQDVTMALADHAGALANRYLRSHPGVDTVTSSRGDEAADVSSASARQPRDPLGVGGPRELVDAGCGDEAIAELGEAAGVSGEGFRVARHVHEVSGA